MKKLVTLFVMGLCLLGMPVASYATLDWQLRWDEANSPQVAKVYIFNPENSNQRFALEVGDVATTADPDPSAPHLIVGQDVTVHLAPGERKIFDLLVYLDIKTASSTQTLATDESTTYLLSDESYRVLQENYQSSTGARQYPYTTMVAPIVRPEEQTNTGQRYTYRSGRGYWTIALTDHDHIAEQLIRTGDRMGALHDSIQEAVWFYTLGNTQLSTEGKKVWQTAFPELAPETTSPTTPGNCVQFVTYVAGNQSSYSSKRNLTVGDILGASDASLGPVVAAEDLSTVVPANTSSSKQAVRVYLMRKSGQPGSQSEYVSVINHSSQIERAIRVGHAENYHPCAIQDVVFYVNRDVATLTLGQQLWTRLGNAAITPTPSGVRPTVCMSPATTQTRTYSANMTFKNLAVLIGAVIPASLLFRRKNRR